VIICTKKFDTPKVTNQLPYPKRKASARNRLELIVEVWEADTENKITRQEIAAFFGYGSSQSITSAAANVLGYSFTSKGQINDEKKEAYCEPGDAVSSRWNEILMNNWKTHDYSTQPT